MHFNLSFKLVVKITIAIIFVAVLIWGWIYIHEDNRFPIKKVTIEGEYHYIEPEQLQKIILPFVDHGFFNIDVNDAQIALAMLPGIKSATIRRVWPGTVKVSLNEEKAIAKWGSKQLLSSNNEIFQPMQVINLSKLPVFEGTKRNSARMIAMYLNIRKIQNTSLNEIIKLKYIGNQWQVYFKDGLDLMLGSKDVIGKLKLFLHFYPTIKSSLKNEAISYIDMRYSNGFAVSLQKNT